MSHRNEYRLSVSLPKPSLTQVSRTLADTVVGAFPDEQDPEQRARNWLDVIKGHAPHAWHGAEHDLRNVSHQWADALFTLRVITLDGVLESITHIQDGHSSSECQHAWHTQTVDPAHPR